MPATVRTPATILILVALLATLTLTPAVPAEAHVVGCKSRAATPTALSGTTYRGVATVRCPARFREPRLFDGDHVRWHRLSSKLVTKTSWRGKHTTVPGSNLGQSPHRSREITQLPRGRCSRGWVRTESTHQVVHANVWTVGGRPFHAGETRTDVRVRSGWRRC